MNKCFFGLALSLLFTAPLLAQADEEVLFTVGDQPVTVGEFRYIYGKTNGETADFSRASVLEYLDLYERFKLKVARARDMGLDTVTALRNELEGYRKQLADNYLVDREVTDPLVAQLYARQQEDVDFSHILFKLPSDTPADTQAIYARALEAKAQLTTANFAERARTLSDDTYSREQGGRIGYVSAPLPRGMHRLERALYDAPRGRVMGPVRTAAGYHLFVREGSRPAAGEVEVAHILIRKGGEASGTKAREKAEAARSALAAGESFEEVAAAYSEDDKTSQQGGYIGFFGINRYNKDFERAAFALTEDGQVSELVESPVGFHLLRRISRRGVQPLDDQRPLLEAAVKQDSRFAEGRQALVQRLKTEYGTQEMEQHLNTYVSGLDATFFEVQRTFPAAERPDVLVQVGDRKLTTTDFEAYLTRNARLRASLQRRSDPAGAARELYASWVDEQVEAYAEAQLENQFPEFRALMREYREGILLFEATKLEVWDKAGEDTTALNTYFAAHRDAYRFGPRAEVYAFRIRTGDDLSAAAVREYAMTHSAEETREEFGRQAVAVGVETYEADRLPEGLRMEAGSQTGPEVDAGSGLTTFSLVKAVEPARRKELSEARGYVIADYQDQLEREWVDQLRKQYTVKVNQGVLNKLIRS